MAKFEANKLPDAPPTREIAQDLDALKTLSAHLLRLAPTASAPVLRALLGRREALLGSIGAQVGRLAKSAEDAGHVPDGAGAQKAVFAQALREVADMDRESQQALRKRSDEVAEEILKLRAGKKWRQNDSRWT